MNKKFTMLVAALLAGGSFSAMAADFELKDDAVQIKNGSKIYLVVDNDKTLNASEIALGITLPTADTNPLVATLATNASGMFSDSNADTKATNYLWTVQTTKEAGTTYYSFVNAKTGKYLAFDATGNLAVAKNADAANSTIWFEVAGNTEANPSLTLTAKGSSKKVSVAGSTVSLDPSGTTTFYAHEAEKQEIGAATLNEKMGGDGFSLAPVGSSYATENENNVFSQQMLAIEIGPNFKNDVTNEEIPEGLYFVVDGAENLKFAEDGTYKGKVILSAFVDKANNESWAVNKQDATDRAFDAIKKCTFVAVSSWDNYATTTVNKYSGLKLITISGDDLILYNQTVDNGKYATTKEQVYIANAKFTVTEEDQYAAPGEYTITVDNARVRQVGKDSHEQQVLTIGVTKIAGVNYVTTVEADKATPFKVSTSSLYDGMKLLNTSKTAAIYTIKFVSGEGVKDSEYGKQLGVAYNSSSIFVAQGADLINTELPQYHFAIVNVDADKKVTFRNIETGDRFTTMLYSTDVENQYKLIGTDKSVRIAEEDAKGIAQYDAPVSMNSMVVELTPLAEVDAYAGFFKKGIDNNEPYRLAFAYNATTDDKLYVAEKTSTSNPKDTYLSETNSLQVVFEPVLKNDETIDESYISTKFAYNNDGKVYYASAKLVNYYTYNLRVVDTENTYLSLNSSNALELGTTKDEFIVKYHYDGSIALVAAPASGTIESNDEAVSITSAGAYTTVDAYAVPDLNNVNLYLEAETIGVTLPAQSGHFTFEAENGGFMNVSDNNEGVVAIRTEAGEDLTFWVDSTDSEKMIPAFYISKAGKFMYNSLDSLNAYNDRLTAGKVNPYKIEKSSSAPNNAKAIFKTAELVNSDTLKTVVDNKEVLVAADPDQNKGILGNVDAFQFQIVKASDAEDNYVIRSAYKTNQYLANFNGVLGFITSKADAMRVIVEGQAAPTANEGVSATEVKVIATDGAINIKNAAGKNVVISTILGQIVANEVLTSDNATISVPAGIAIVSIDGEEAVKVSVR